jgi:hypothetical protein
VTDRKGRIGNDAAFFHELCSAGFEWHVCDSVAQPDGQISESCPAPIAKIFCFAADPNQQYIAHRPVPQRGARAIVTDAGRDAVDTDGAEDDRRLRWTAKSCGPDAPTLESSRWSNPPATVAKEPGHRGEHEGNR